ncbi:hypothetical protein C8F04DRAFT_1268410 [Mycena alexandri]|uniref:Uncharacterized protein n=1 Tax=Mycena alexandri TaxID=1745969 RepID=A0AAD6SEM6_9AGAR|nr:hypothetical protein C8F04DRAFT_1268410 [Mycena alexandri]
MSRTRCEPRYFPQPGHENTITHDGRKDGRYYVVGAGHCGNGVFTDPKIADRETDGFSGYEKRAAKRWTGVGGVEEIWASFCDRLHRDGCHTGRLPDGWNAPVPVVRGCGPSTSSVAPAAPALAPLNVGERRVDPLVFPAPATSASAPAPATPRQDSKSGGSGNTWASPLVVRSSASPSPLRPPPSIPPDLAREFDSLPSSRCSEPQWGRRILDVSRELDPEHNVELIGLAFSLGAYTESSPNAGYDTDFYYDDDTDEDEAPGPSRMSTGRRYWAVRGLDELFTDVDSAFDALRQNMDRLCYMEVRTSTNSTMLRQFASS